VEVNPDWVSLGLASPTGAYSLEQRIETLGLRIKSAADIWADQSRPLRNRIGMSSTLMNAALNECAQLFLELQAARFEWSGKPQDTPLQ